MSYPASVLVYTSRTDMMPWEFQTQRDLSIRKDGVSWAALDPNILRSSETDASCWVLLFWTGFQSSSCVANQSELLLSRFLVILHKYDFAAKGFLVKLAADSTGVVSILITAARKSLHIILDSRVVWFPERETTSGNFRSPVENLSVLKFMVNHSISKFQLGISFYSSLSIY